MRKARKNTATRQIIHIVGEGWGCVIIPDYVQPLFCVYTAINLIMPSFFQTYPGISPVYACNK